MQQNSCYFTVKAHVKAAASLLVKVYEGPESNDVIRLQAKNVALKHNKHSF